jgi:hypothetical protein
MEWLKVGAGSTERAKEEMSDDSLDVGRGRESTVRGCGGEGEGKRRVRFRGRAGRKPVASSWAVVGDMADGCWLVRQFDFAVFIPVAEEDYKTRDGCSFLITSEVDNDVMLCIVSDPHASGNQHANYLSSQSVGENSAPKIYMMTARILR